MALYVTLKCNLRCRHCYIDGSPAGSRLAPVDRSRLVSLVASMGKPVDLTGGEPFMVSDLGDLVRELTTAGATIGSVFTNATLLRRRDRTLHEIIDAVGRVRWYVSLDGDEVAHDQLRGPGSFRAALEGADRLQKLGQQVFINTMLHSGVDTHSLERLHQVVGSHGFERWRLDSPFNGGAWIDHRESDSLTDEYTIDLLSEVVGRWASQGMPFELEAGHVLKYLDDTLYFLDSYSPDDPVCPCRTFPIWPNADVSWCQDLSEGEFVVGNLLRDGLAHVYEAYAPFKTRTISDVASANGVCSSCNLLSFCGTGCRVGALGDGSGLDGPDPGACRLHTERLYLPVARSLCGSIAARPTR
ncbi:radical SAM/SPASM domain-containing protein [Tessaracoccus coleopterorum]|uniref:radical SAM/SPASM domain-containing protein n=1 Tax=Tessaracoccus coleopterorum TaxID=2714950 RepID=UPI002F90A61C